MFGTVTVTDLASPRFALGQTSRRGVPYLVSGGDDGARGQIWDLGFCARPTQMMPMQEFTVMTLPSVAVLLPLRNGKVGQYMDSVQDIKKQ